MDAREAYERQKSSRQEEYARRRTDVLAEKKNVTGKISETCRYIGFGLLIAYYTVLSGDAQFAKDMRGGCGVLILHLMAIAAVLAIVFDYLHYFFGSRSVDEALKDDDAMYPKTRSYKARAFFYHAKQVAVVVGAALLLLVVVLSTFQGLMKPGVPKAETSSTK